MFMISDQQLSNQASNGLNFIDIVNLVQSCLKINTHTYILYYCAVLFLLHAHSAGLSVATVLLSVFLCFSHISFISLFCKNLLLEHDSMFLVSHTLLIVVFQVFVVRLG